MKKSFLYDLLKVDSRTISDEPGAVSDSADISFNGTDESDDLYDKAVAIVLRDKKSTIGHVQRALRIGYNKAADLINRMEAEGIISKPIMPAVSAPQRIHGSFVSDNNFNGTGESESDDLYDKAVAIVLRDKKSTIGHVQRALRIGYNKAVDLINRMEAEGIVSKPNISGKREIIVPADNA